MAKNNEVLIKLIVDGNQAWLQFANGEKRAVNFGNTVKKTSADVTASLKNIASAAGIAFGVDQIRQFTFEAIQLAGKMEGVRVAFNRINQPGLLNKLREATKGTVSDLNLMQLAVRASNFQIPLTQLADLFEFARRRAKDTGEDVNFLVESIIMGIGRKSPQILDNLGISAVRLREKFKGISEEAVDIGTVAAAVGDIVNEELAKMGADVDTSAEKTQRLAAKWENIKTQVGEGLAPAISDIADSITRMSAAGDGSGITKLIQLLTTMSGNVYKTWMPTLYYAEDIVNVLNKTFEKDVVLNPKGKKQGSTNYISPWPGINLNQTGTWIPAVKTLVDEMNKPTSKTVQMWSAANKTFNQIQERVKQLKDELGDMVPGQDAYIKKLKEIESLEKLISTNKKASNEEKKKEAAIDKVLLETEVEILKAKKQQAEFDLTGTDLYKDGNGDYRSRKAAKGFVMKTKSVPSFTPVTQTQQELQDTLKLKEAYNMVGEAGQEAFDRTADAMAGSIQLFKDNNNFAALFLNTLAQIVFKAILLQWITSITGLFSGLGSSGGATAGRSAVMSGGHQPIGGVNVGPVPFAKGGIVTSPTLAMIGEAGSKEAVIPLERLHQFTGGASLQPLINVMEKQNEKMNAWAASLRMEWDGKDFVTDSGKAKQRYNLMRY
jgi:hypothetical protein